jgi:hypothetical protein
VFFSLFSILSDIELNLIAAVDREVVVCVVFVVHCRSTKHTSSILRISSSTRRPSAIFLPSPRSATNLCKTTRSQRASNFFFDLAAVGSSEGREEGAGRQRCGASRQPHQPSWPDSQPFHARHGSVCVRAAECPCAVRWIVLFLVFIAATTQHISPRLFLLATRLESRPSCSR